ncbi:MAG: hypothetical protein GY869_28090 [Planctomycetes bacterium]|nr:hypothetical protein [Planctomycetota bacterium]
MFDLIGDPGELVDLARDSNHVGLLELWRERMVAHLAERGSEWVLEGKLQIRKESLLYSPNYPGKQY